MGLVCLWLLFFVVSCTNSKIKSEAVISLRTLYFYANHDDRQIVVITANINISSGFPTCLHAFFNGTTNTTRISLVAASEDTGAWCYLTPIFYASQYDINKSARAALPSLNFSFQGVKWMCTHAQILRMHLIGKKIILSCSIVLEEVIADMGLTSIHLEWASTITRNIPLRKGPAKSRCSRDHGCAGQGCSGANGRDYCEA